MSPPTPIPSVLRVISRDPVAVAPGTPLRVVAQLMDEESIGAVLVCDRHGAAGIVSERDLVVALAAGTDPDAGRAQDVMSADLAWVSVEADPLSVADLMLENEIRHVLVVTEQQTVGIVSIRDILMVVASVSRRATGASTRGSGTG